MKGLSLLLGLIFGIIMAAILICIIMKKITTDKSLKAKYDERQEVVRGRAYKYGFLTMCILNILVAFMGKPLSKYLEYGVLVFISVCISLLVFAGYCIFNEAYIGINEKPVRSIILLFAIGVLNIWLGVMNYVLQRGVTEKRLLKVENVNLIAGVLIIVIVIMMIVKQLINKKRLG